MEVTGSKEIYNPSLVIPLEQGLEMGHVSFKE
jgi:predicted RNA methylase